MHWDIKQRRVNWNRIVLNFRWNEWISRIAASIHWKSGYPLIDKVLLAEGFSQRAAAFEFELYCVQLCWAHVEDCKVVLFVHFLVTMITEDGTKPKIKKRWERIKCETKKISSEPQIFAFNILWSSCEVDCYSQSEIIPMQIKNLNLLFSCTQHYGLFGKGNKCKVY